MEKLWFKIGEAASAVGVSPKELRYWEQHIPGIAPRRSQGNLRYYHKDELPRLMQIKEWLSQGLTVPDCCNRLQEGIQPVFCQPSLFPEPEIRNKSLQHVQEALRQLLTRLTENPKL